MKFNLSLNALSNSYQSGELNPRQLILALREQAIEQADYNAWIYLLEEAELEPYLAKLEQSQAEDLPLYGVPFAIKDNIDLAGIPTTAACPDFAYTPETSATVVALLIQAGAVPLGKTNLDQFATGLVGTRSPWGEGKNSFNPEYISGGSSAGSAIATALGQVSFSLGTDTAGSGRVPAALNNLIGHKPSKGLLSTRGVVPACRSLDCVSIFTWLAEDAAAILDVAAQYDVEDPFARENHYANRSRYFNTQPQSDFTIAIPAELDFQSNVETEALFQRAVEAVKALGGRVTTIDFAPFMEAAKLLYEGPWVAERTWATQSVNRDAMHPVIREIISQGDSKTAIDSFDAQYRLATLKKRCDALLADVDMVMMPTCPTFFTREQMRANPIGHNSTLGTYTNFVNLLDYAATAVPVGFTNSGLSWGVSLFSHAFSDIKLLSYVGRLQRAFDLPLATSGFSLPVLPQPQAFSAPQADDIAVVVCGAHLKGQPLNWQLTERGARLMEATQTTANYQLYALADKKRPALVRNTADGAPIEIEIWSMPRAHFGSFVAGIPAPLGIGKVEVSDNRWISGFICDGYGLEGAENITDFGGWRAWIKAR